MAGSGLLCISGSCVSGLVCLVEQTWHQCSYMLEQSQGKVLHQLGRCISRGSVTRPGTREVGALAEYCGLSVNIPASPSALPAAFDALVKAEVPMWERVARDSDACVE